MKRCAGSNCARGCIFNKCTEDLEDSGKELTHNNKAQNSKTSHDTKVSICMLRNLKQLTYNIVLSLEIS